MLFDMQEVEGSIFLREDDFRNSLLQAVGDPETGSDLSRTLKTAKYGVGEAN